MNKEEFKHIIEEVKIPIELLQEREQLAMKKGEKYINKPKYKAKLLFFIACGLFLTLLGTSFVSTNVAEAISKLPVIGPIYAQFNDIAADEIESNHLATAIHKTDSKNGLTMTVKEAVYDGSRLIVTVEYQANKPFTELNEKDAGFSYITVNGEEPRVAIGSSKYDNMESNKIVQYFEFTFEKVNEFSKDIIVSLYSKDIFGYKGDLAVSFPLERINTTEKKFHGKVQAKTADKKYSLQVKDVIFSSLSTRIDLEYDYPEKEWREDTWSSLDFIVTDNLGNVYKDPQLQSGSSSLKGKHIVLNLPPMNDTPKSLIVRPYYEEGNNGYLDEDTFNKLVLEIPLEDIER